MNARGDAGQAGTAIFKACTERAGFEPAMEFDPHTRLAGECLQPLGHLSRLEGAKSRTRWRCRASAHVKSLDPRLDWRGLCENGGGGVGCHLIGDTCVRT